MNRWMMGPKSDNELTDGQTYGWMDGWMDGLTNRIGFGSKDEQTDK
jgi:hypothetical protein